MLVRSIALTTELALAATRGRITDRGDYLVVETPDDPGYYDGNVIVLPAAPQVGEVAYWRRRFEAELGTNPAIRHVTFWWDGTNGDTGAVDELRAAGFSIITGQLMLADQVTAPAPSRRYEIRTLTPDEVSRTADLAWVIADRHDDSYRRFLQRRAAWHASLVTRAAATFWGAFETGATDTPPELPFVASLGLVPVGALARYQDVQTLSAHRRRGLASALLAASAGEALRAPEIERVAIVAEPQSEAARVYERAGFRVAERIASARREPQ